MIERRGVIAALLVLALVAFGAAVLLVPQPGPQPTADAASASPSATTPSPADAATARAVTATIARVERAFNAGDVRLLCRPGAVVDAAVVRHRGAGCERQLETLIGDEPPLRLTVRGVSVRPDLATATVAPRSGSTVRVDLVRGPRGWLLSFSDGDDPMPALAGTA
jgi:hypothetical protein